MAHGQEPDAYDYLATSKVSELTVAQLEQTLENSFLNKTNIEFWKGPITMNKLLEVSRTYPGAGMPIPEASAVATSGSLPAGNTFDFRPTGTEEWQILGIEATSASGTPTGGVFLYDGTTSVIMHSGSSGTTGTNLFPMEAPFIITNSLYLRCVNMDGSIAQTFDVAYHKVSL